MPQTDLTVADCTAAGRRIVTVFDSPEEFEFDSWCREAGQAGFLAEFTYHPDPFKLSERAAIKVLKKMKTKVKEAEKFLLHPHEYTPDFKLSFDIIRWGDMAPMFEKAEVIAANDGYVYIDIKPVFSRFHDAKSFSINQKWVYAKYGVYVNKIVPKQWFKATWTPEAARYTQKTNKLRDCYKNFRTLNQIKGFYEERRKIR